MVTLPPQFIATKYPGYFYNPEDETLYSLKVSGILTPLTFTKPNRWNNMWRYGCEGGFYISVEGCRKLLPIEYLKDLKPHDAEITMRTSR